mgnify:CR=1 FL=1
MCIRDSAAAEGLQSPHRENRRAAAAHQHGTRDAGPAADGCLLYTSDAADERSSVDLGGRRIIKKKKHD